MKKTTGTIGCLPILIVVLIFLRWTDIIIWPWWLVLLPLWGTACFWAVYAIIEIMIKEIITLCRKLKKNKEAKKDLNDINRMK